MHENDLYIVDDASRVIVLIEGLEFETSNTNEKDEIQLEQLKMVVEKSNCAQSQKSIKCWMMILQGKSACAENRFFELFYCMKCKFCKCRR